MNVNFESIEKAWFKPKKTVLDELEEWIEEQHQFIIEIPAYTKEISIEHKTMEICYENILDKIQELKKENEINDSKRDV